MDTHDAPDRSGRFSKGGLLRLTVLLAGALLATDVRVSARAGTPQPAAAGEATPAIVISVRVIAGSLLSSVELTALCGEVDRIWRQQGVRLAWQNGNGIVDMAHPAHLVLVVDATSDMPVEARSARLATLHPVRHTYSQGPPAGRPDAVIKVSLPRARRLADLAFAREPISAARGMWMQLRVPVLMGRAVAHEVGHYLLESRDHTAHGLMRASYGPDDATCDPDYRVDTAQVGRMRALWVMRGR